MINTLYVIIKKKKIKCFIHNIFCTVTNYLSLCTCLQSALHIIFRGTTFYRTQGHQKRILDFTHLILGQ